VEDFAWRDYHFIHHGWDDVLSMSASSDKQAWSRGNQLACNSISVPPVHTRQWQFMHDFFSITNNWSPG
jgi:hypothetical protein